LGGLSNLKKDYRRHLPKFHWVGRELDKNLEITINSFALVLRPKVSQRGARAYKVEMGSGEITVTWTVFWYCRGLGYRGR
jgi:hypothetical protein